jgi:hypothetical protein
LIRNSKRTRCSWPLAAGGACAWAASSGLHRLEDCAPASRLIPFLLGRTSDNGCGGALQASQRSISERIHPPETCFAGKMPFLVQRKSVARCTPTMRSTSAVDIRRSRWLIPSALELSTLGVLREAEALPSRNESWMGTSSPSLCCSRRTFSMVIWRLPRDPNAGLALTVPEWRGFGYLRKACVGHVANVAGARSENCRWRTRIPSGANREEKERCAFPNNRDQIRGSLIQRGRSSPASRSAIAGIACTASCAKTFACGCARPNTTDAATRSLRDKVQASVSVT